MPVADHGTSSTRVSRREPDQLGQTLAGLSRRSIGRFRPSSGERQENHSTTPAGVSEKRNWLTIRAIARTRRRSSPSGRRGLRGREPALKLARAHTDQLCELEPAAPRSLATSQATSFLAGSIVGDRLVLCDRRRTPERASREPAAAGDGIRQVGLHERDLRTERRAEDELDVVRIHARPQLARCESTASVSSRTRS